MTDTAFIESLKEGDGCRYGDLTRQKVDIMEDNFKTVDSKLDKINDRLFYGIIFLIILSFFAGINVWDGMLKMLLK